eukprot:11179975-Lingulodinium_polyedra.AAC.1
MAWRYVVAGRDRLGPGCSRCSCARRGDAWASCAWGCGAAKANVGNLPCGCIWPRMESRHPCRR